MAEVLKIETGTLNNPITEENSGYYYNGYIYVNTPTKIYKVNPISKTSEVIYNKPSSTEFFSLGYENKLYIFNRHFTSGMAGTYPETHIDIYLYEIDSGNYSEFKYDIAYGSSHIASNKSFSGVIIDDIMYVTLGGTTSSLPNQIMTFSLIFNLSTNTLISNSYRFAVSSWSGIGGYNYPDLLTQQTHVRQIVGLTDNTSYYRNWNEGTWNSFSSPNLRFSGSSNYYKDNKLYYIGGSYNDQINNKIYTYDINANILTETDYTLPENFIQRYCIEAVDGYYIFTNSGFIKLSYVESNLTHKIKSSDGSVTYATFTNQAPITNTYFGFDCTTASYKIATTAAMPICGQYQPQIPEGKTLVGYSGTPNSNSGSFLLFSDVNQEINTDFTFYEVYGTYRPPIVIDESVVGTWAIDEIPNPLVEGAYEVEYYCSAVPHQRYSYLISCNNAMTIYASTSDSIDDGVLIFNYGWTNDAFRTVVITKDPDDEVFKTWIKASGEKIGDGESVCVATVDYEDNNVANLKVGQKATLTCKDQMMTDDVLVTIDDNCVIPAGTVKVTSNGIYPVIDKAGVVVDVPAIIDVDALPTEDIDETATYRVYEAVDEKSNELFGTWKFNDVLDINSVINQEISFTSGNYVCTGIEVDGNYSGYPTLFYVYINEDGTSKTVTAYTNGEWLQPELKTVNFGFDEQEVSEDYFAWHKANANRYVDSLNRYNNGEWTNYTEVCGSFEATENGIIDVTHYKQIIINVAGGGNGNGIIEVDQLPRRGIYTNKVYLCNGALYRYVDNSWLEYILITNALATKDGELFKVMEEPEA